MKTMVLLVWISCWINVCTSAQGRYAQKLLNDLMENYSSALRPVEDTDKTLNVTLQITLSQIKDMDERNQVLTTYLWIRQTWFDAYLKWDKEEYDGLEVIRIPSNLVWRPDIVLYNKADEEASGPAETNVVLRYNGEITWDMPAITKSSCVVDVSYFPFDWQWCNLTFGSWTYNGNQVDIAMGMDSGDLSDFVENVEWECHGMPAVRNVIMYGCCSDPYPDITYTLHLKRRSLFYIFNLLLPCFLISFLGKYYIATMTMITASTSLTIFIMNIHFCGAEAKPVPHWAKVLIIDYMSKILFVYEVGENCTTPESERTPLYSEEPMSGNSALARNHYHDDLYHDGCYQDDCHRLGPYQYGNGHLQNHHSTHQNHLDNSRYANGGHRDDRYSNRSNQNHHSNPSQTSKGEGGEEKREPLRRYHHIGTEELDYQAPPPGNLQNGGLNEPLPYPKEKHLSPASDPACACSCPCPHHKQVVYNIQYIANCFREQRATCAKGAEWKKVAKVMDRFFMWIFFIMVFLMSILIIGKAT